MSVEKTKHLKRLMVPIDHLHPNPLNPNEMDDKQFNLLADNMEKVGFTDPILCRPHPDIAGEYRIIGGQHRWEVAKLQGYTEAPVTVITDPEFTSDEEAFQIVRHNIIGGKMSPVKFAKLVDSLNEKYGDEVASELFGFTDEDEFRKLVAKTAKSLPKELQSTFKDAAKELKSIDELAKLLNSLFANYGESLPYGYMFVDFGGYESIWLRLQTGQLKQFRELSATVRGRNKALDHLFAEFIKRAQTDTALLDELLANAPDVQVKAEAAYATLDYLDN